MIDSHCHLDFAAFDADRDEVLARSAATGITRILIPGTQASQWSKQIALCEETPSLDFALGIHPYFLSTYQPDHLDQLQTLLNKHRQNVLAVGEIGLDFAIDTPPGLQEDVFVRQLELATDFDLPVILHHRKSHNALIRLLKQYRVARGGVVHAFSGSLQEAQTYIELGFKLGIGGTITYERARKTREVVSQVPLQSLLLETDSPDMPLHGFQGQRNEPSQVARVAACLAQLRDVPTGEVVRRTDQTYQQLFFP